MNKLNEFFFSADDWGMSPGVNEGILELVEAGLIRRVSLLGNGRYVAHALDKLLTHRQVEMGLHFNLTLGEPLALGRGTFFTEPNSKLFLPRQKLFRNWMRHKGSKGLQEEAVKEARAQFERLKSLGVQCKHIDGHEHVHLLPGLMRAIQPVLQLLGVSRTRLPLEGKQLVSRKFPLFFLSLSAKRDFQALQLHWLPFFYPSKRDLAAPDRLQAKLVGKEGHEILVHPAKFMDFEALKVADPYREGRLQEFETLRMVCDTFKSGSRRE